MWDTCDNTLTPNGDGINSTHLAQRPSQENPHRGGLQSFSVNLTLVLPSSGFLVLYSKPQKKNKKSTPTKILIHDFSICWVVAIRKAYPLVI